MVIQYSYGEADIRIEHISNAYVYSVSSDGKLVSRIKSAPSSFEAQAEANALVESLGLA